MTRSSFSGNITELPYISCDNFTNLKKRAYFLSHCHTDHTEGLYSEEFLNFLEKSEDVYIYMSRPSSVIVSCETKNDKLMEFVKPLDLERTLICIPPDPINNIPEEYITVTTITAGHCFGSIMFLFQTKYKTILFTGDFRINENYVTEYTQFHDQEKVINIDALYVDTTFQTYDSFPRRSDSMSYVIKEVGNFLEKGGCVALHTSAKYGYEFVFNEIYNRLGLKVYVNDEKWRLYSKFPKLVPGLTNKQEETKIHVCSNRNEHMRHEKCLPNIDTTQPYLYIHFSALKWSNYQIDDPMFERIEYKTIKNQRKVGLNYNLPLNSLSASTNGFASECQVGKLPTSDFRQKSVRIDVCFPTHCSKTELLSFVNYLNPNKIVGFPEPYILNKSKRAKEIPLVELNERKEKDIKRKKVDSNLLKEMFDV